MSSKKHFTKNVSEPWYSLIKGGLKKVEGRLLKGEFINMNKGDYVTWTNRELGFPRSCTTLITSIHHYDSFKDYLISEGLPKCLPGVENLKEGLSIYYNYFSEEQEQQYGVVALRLKRLNSESSKKKI